MKKKTLWDRASVGFYEPVKIKGEILWDVRLSKDSGFFCKRQEDAQMMSMLVRIMRKLGIDENEELVANGRKRSLSLQKMQHSDRRS